MRCNLLVWDAVTCAGRHPAPPRLLKSVSTGLWVQPDNNREAEPLPYEMTPEADVERTAAEYDRKAQARLRELAALHGVTDPARLAQIAKSDPVLHDLVSSMFLARRIPQVMLESGHVPVIGDMRDEAIRWRRSTGDGR